MTTQVATGWAPQPHSNVDSATSTTRRQFAPCWTRCPSANAGFSSGTPWIGVNPNHAEINVAAAMADPGSVLHHYRRLIALRKELPVLVEGDYALVEDTDPRVYAFTRTLGEERLLFVLVEQTPRVSPRRSKQRRRRRQGRRRSANKPVARSFFKGPDCPAEAAPSRA